MKKTLTVFAILSFLFSSGQIPMGKFSDGVVYFINGDTTKGSIKKIKNKIKFIKEANSEAVILDHNTILGFEARVLGIAGRYHYKTFNGSVPILYKKYAEGKINLYAKIKYNSHPTYNTLYEDPIFFFEKEKKLFKIGKKIKKAHLIYFNDCEVLIKKIKKREIKKSDVFKIVDFYNNCE